MHTLKYLIVLLGFIYHTYSADPCKKVCILDNVNCVTRGGAAVYKTVVHGVKKLNVPLDPLNMDVLEGEMEGVKYKLTNISMAGLKNCTVTKLDLNVTAGSWEQDIQCKKLVTHFNFKADKNTDKRVLRGKGMAYLIAKNYDIFNYGQYSVFVNEDHRPHFFIMSDYTKTDHQEKSKFNITQSDLDKKKEKESVDYLNEHWHIIENHLNKRLVRKAMKILIDKINNYIKRTTMGEVLPAKTS